MRDRLRVVQCPTEIVDRIGGWQELSTEAPAMVTAFLDHTASMAYGDLTRHHDWLHKNY